MSLIYIAAKYGASTPEEIAWNIARATFLGKLALAQHHTPIVPHVLGAALFGQNETLETREKALAYGLDLVRFVAASRGGMWVLTRDNDTISSGCEEELSIFTLASYGRRAWIYSWAEFCDAATRAGLGAEWAALINPPIKTPTNTGDTT